MQGSKLYCKRALGSRIETILANITELGSRAKTKLMYYYALFAS